MLSARASKTNWHDSLVTITAKVLLAATIFFLVCCGTSALTGCGGLRKDALVLPPDAPVVIQEVRGSDVRVSAYDADQNSLVEYGWVDGATLVGRTASAFDWAGYIEKRKRD